MLLSVILVAALQLGGVCSAPPPSTEMVTLEAELGATAIFPCNGSAYLGEGSGTGEEDEGTLFLWEVMGRDVVAFKDGAMVEGSQYEGRVRLAPEDSVRKGNWSLVLEGVKPNDVNMYECIMPGRRTLTNAWLIVGPPEENTFWVSAWLGDSTHLPCQAPDAELSQDLHFWWEKDGVAVPHSEEDEERIHVETAGNHVGLVISQVLISDRGLYHCFYRISPSPEPRRGSPEIIRLTVLGSEPTDNEMTTETTVTENNSLGTMMTPSMGTTSGSWSGTETPPGSWSGTETTFGSWSETETTSGSWSETETTSGPWSGTETTSGSWSGTETTSGSWSGTETTSGNWSGTETTSGSWSGTETTSGNWSGTETTSGSLRGTETTSGSWSGTETPSATQTEEEVDTWARVTEASPLTSGGQDSIQSDNLPWVRFSLIAGVLALTGTTLCILGARRMI